MELIKKQLSAREEVFWMNTNREAPASSPFSFEAVREAEARLERFAPFIATAFPETQKAGGIIESPLFDLSRTIEQYDRVMPGHYWLKADSHLPVSGSVKARGGVYEILHHAERLALDAGLLKVTDDYSILSEPRFREFFSRHRIAVGSTGNLGLSIGIISRVFGFEVTIHMSTDAKAWKKKMLREKGAEVIEYEADYSVAVESGRRQAAGDPMTHFVDDENSKVLFMGYAVAALRLQRQLEDKGITVDAKHPLLVYLPCGVGGAPGGITFGLKSLFGDHVHVFFAEPVESPCMLLGVLTGRHDGIDVSEIGLTNRTEADGLAVGRPSGLVGKTVGHLIDGFYTLEDRHLYPHLKRLHIADQIRIEPSAAISLAGFEKVLSSGYMDRLGLDPEQSTHIAWATGGQMVPDDEFLSWLKK